MTRTGVFVIGLIVLVLVGVGSVRASTCTWTGATSGNWATGGNWTGNAGNCTGATGPKTNSTLVFPTGTANQSMTNNTTAGNTYVITISGGGYTMAGNAIKLTTITDTDTSGGSNTISLAITLTAATTIPVTTATDTLTISGVISGAFAVTKTLAGTLVLSGANTYSKATTITTGTLSISADDNLGTAPATATANYLVFGGGTLVTTATFTLSANRGVEFTSTGIIDPATTTTLTYGGIATSTGGLTVDGAGTLVMSGTNTYTGINTLEAGTLSVGADLNLGAAPATVKATSLTFTGGTLAATANFTMTTDRGMTFTSTAKFAPASGMRLTYGGVATGAGGLTLNGAGQLLLSGTNTFTGIDTLIAGTLFVSADLNLGAAPATVTPASLTFDGGELVYTTGFTLASNRGMTFNSTATIAGLSLGLNLTYAGVATGPGGLTVAGGTVVLTGTNTFTGIDTLTSGELSVGADHNLGAVPGSVTPTSLTFNGGTLVTTASFTLSSNRGITLSTTGVFWPSTGTTLTYAGVATGSGGLEVDQVGQLVLSGTNTYTGNTLLTDGTLSISADANLGAVPGSVTPTSVTFNGGTLATTASFTLASNRGMMFTSPAVFAPATGTTLTYGGVATGSGGGLTLIGAGTFVVSGANTYTGTASINAGTFAVNGSQSSSAISVNGGTLEGSGTVGVVTSTATGGGVNPGSGSAPAMLTTGNINLSAGAPTFTVQLNGTTPGTQYTQLSTAGTINLTGAALSATSTITPNPANGTVFTILNNTGSNTITGTFSGLAEGATVTLGLQSYIISYLGGSGHSVTLTAATPVIGLVESVSPLTGTIPGTNMTYTVAFTDNGLRSAFSPTIVTTIPNNSDFELGSVSEVLGTTGLSVAVAYSNNGGSTYTYTPVSGGGGAAAGYDRTVTNIQWTFTGTLSQVSPNNAGSVSFTAVIQ